MTKLNYKEFEIKLKEAGFTSKAKFANILGIQAQAIVRWKERDTCPSYVTKALEWAKFAKEYDKVVEAENDFAKFINNKERLDFLQNENIELKKELDFLNFMKNEIKRIIK